MIDVDDFKSINDLHGHPQGDVVLRYVGEVLRKSSRDVDVAARYGGEELALILPHTTTLGGLRDRRACAASDRAAADPVARRRHNSSDHRERRSLLLRRKRVRTS